MRKIKKVASISLLSLFTISFSACKPVADFFDSLYYDDKIVTYDHTMIDINNKPFHISKGGVDEGIVKLEERGILFNEQSVGALTRIIINIANDDFKGAKLYLGVTPLSFDEEFVLKKGHNEIFLDKEYSHFVVQSDEGTTFIDRISFDSVDEEIDVSLKEIPTLTINTENSETVYSKYYYVDCFISSNSGEFEDILNAPASIKVRGNSTAKRPKQPYRIKFDKKASLFGYKESKNYVLLADYMDGSRMHNYSALEFAKLVKGEDYFSVKPKHVRLKMNGVDKGLYLLGEHIDEKKEHLNIKQDNVWDLSFNDINFLIERDSSTVKDNDEIEGETYFKTGGYVFALKYPKKDDFVEIDEMGYEISHEEEFKDFFSDLESYMTSICSIFDEYKNDKTKFGLLNQLMDIDSLVNCSIVDLLFAETGHGSNSYRIYKNEMNKLVLGPSWDFDSTLMHLPYDGVFVQKPFEYKKHDLSFGDTWGKSLLNDKKNGEPLFKTKWESLDFKDDYFASLYKEIQSISYDLVDETALWMNDNYCIAFDNSRYTYKYLLDQYEYLTTHFANINK